MPSSGLERERRAHLAALAETYRYAGFPLELRGPKTDEVAMGSGPYRVLLKLATKRLDATPSIHLRDLCEEIRTDYEALAAHWS